MISWIIQPLLWCKEALCLLFTEKYVRFKRLQILRDFFCFAYIIIVVFGELYVKQFSYFITFRNLNLCVSYHCWLAKSAKVRICSFKLKIIKTKWAKILYIWKVCKISGRCCFFFFFFKLMQTFKEAGFVSLNSLLDVFLFWSFYRNRYDLLDILSSWHQVIVQLARQASEKECKNNTFQHCPIYQCSRKNKPRTTKTKYLP